MSNNIARIHFLKKKMHFWIAILTQLHLTDPKSNFGLFLLVGPLAGVGQPPPPHCTVSLVQWMGGVSVFGLIIVKQKNLIVL